MKAFIYLIIVFCFYKATSWFDNYKQKKEEQKKMWEVLSKSNTSGNSGTATSVGGSPIPRRKYRI